MRNMGRPGVHGKGPVLLTNRLKAIPVIAVFVFLAGCSGLQDGFVVTESRFMMGTVVEITVVHADTVLAKSAIGLAYDAMDRIEKMTTSYSDTNALARLNSEAGGVPATSVNAMGRPPRRRFFPDDFHEILKSAIAVSNETDGAFDITAGPLVKAWSFHDAGHVPSHQSIQTALEKVGYEKLDVASGEPDARLEEDGMLVDLGGIAKGYAVDQGFETLLGEGVSNALVNAGGDVALIGPGIGGKGWRIGLKHPREEGFYLKLLLEEGAAASSGDYERFFMEKGKRYHHILDPRTGYPAEPCISVTVLAEDAMTADAFSTGLFVLGPVRGLEVAESNANIEALFIYARGDSLLETSTSGFGEYVMTE
jgi:thiamine biosynthesis lipoprotein